MARDLILSLDGHETAVKLVKLDREKLYGEVEIEAFDEKGNEATIKVLAADGRTLIDKGGTALATVTEDGDSISRTELIAVDEDGDAIEPVPSSFGKPNVLKKAEVEDYLSQVVKMIYLLEAVGDADLTYIHDHLAEGQIYTFPFSYRGGLEYDNAYLLGKDENTFMVVGKTGDLQYVKLNQATKLDNIEESEVSADDLDFGLL
ncbi:MAG: hypothetical protein AB7F88_01835 [Pyrinomonadaceae bacterium]